MEIISWKKDKGGQMVRVTRKEALSIILSLTSQLLTNNPNTDRQEFEDQTGKYFSISVIPEKLINN